MKRGLIAFHLAYVQVLSVKDMNVIVLKIIVLHTFTSVHF